MQLRAEVILAICLVAPLSAGCSGSDTSEELDMGSGAPNTESPGLAPGNSGAGGSGQTGAPNMPASNGMSEGNPTNVMNGTDAPGAPMGTGGTNGTAAPTAPPDLIPGPGFFLGGTCFAPCASDVTDPDAAGMTDGFGFEQGQSCIVVGSAPSMSGLPCVPGTTSMDGDGYLVSQLCVPACSVPRLADAQGYGFEAQQTCVVDASPAALQAARCAILPREGLPEPGDGFQLSDGCFPPCVNAAGTDAAGFGFEQNRACLLPGSDASIQAVPCVPAPATVVGFCPPAPIQCPSANGVTLTCGCGFREGFAERKQVILSTAGASQYFLASAMMETATLTADYPLGDVFPNGMLKTGDAFNGGIAKQNWGMMRRCHPEWNGLAGGSFMTGAELNTNLALDVQVYNECRAMFGDDWWSGHRLGANNLGNDSPDVQRFRAAMDWTNAMLTGHLADDVFFYVVVPAI